LRILHIIAGDLNGGAGKGAYILHQALVASGVKSKVFTNSKVAIEDKSITTILISEKAKLLNMLRARLDRLPSLFYKDRGNVLSGGFFGFDFTQTKEYRDADIIHLHWINSAFVDIKDLRKIDKPIVWTMRDMWPMTGGCHYAMECENYQYGCGKCQLLKSNIENDLSRIILKRKKKYLPKTIKMIGISHWISDLARNSTLFKNYDIRTISNNININDFFPLKKSVAREILGIMTNKKIILCGATQPKDYYKGFNKFIQAINILNKEDYYLCFFGKLDENLVSSLGFEYKNFGFLYDVVSLRLLYSSADVFVAPSIMDAFGKTIAESMACKTPVVCFNATGPKDIVSHKIDGYSAVAFDVEDLANGIEWILNNNQYDMLCHNAREKIIKEFDSSIIAKKYIQLYEEILNV